MSLAARFMPKNFIHLLGAVNATGGIADVITRQYFWNHFAFSVGWISDCVIPEAAGIPKTTSFLNQIRELVPLRWKSQ
jgi:hypothetical protein